MRQKYLSNQKLWKIIAQPDGYYYEIRLAGTVLQRVKVEPKVLEYLGLGNETQE